MYADIYTCQHQFMTSDVKKINIEVKLTLKRTKGTYD